MGVPGGPGLLPALALSRWSPRRLGSAEPRRFGFADAPPAYLAPSCRFSPRRADAQAPVFEARPVLSAAPESSAL